MAHDPSEDLATVEFLEKLRAVDAAASATA
jgi:hypothetical protein